MSSIACSSSGELATSARSSAYVGAPQNTSPILALSLEWSRVFKRSSTKMELVMGIGLLPWWTPCRIGNGLEWLPHNRTEQEEEVYHTTSSCSGHARCGMECLCVAV